MKRTEDNEGMKNATARASDKTVLLILGRDLFNSLKRMASLLQRFFRINNDKSIIHINRDFGNKHCWFTIVPTKLWERFRKK